MKTIIVIAGCLALVTAGSSATSAERVVEPTKLWRYRAASGGCEIAAFSAASERLFVTVGSGVDVVSVRSGSRIGEIAAPPVFHATSIACTGDVVAIAWAADDKRHRGCITFYDAHTLAKIASYNAGFLPDMITFTPDGKTLLAANEGEPTVDYSFDPESSITIINVTDGWEHADVDEAVFTDFNRQRDGLIAAGVQIFGPNQDDAQGLATVAQDLEPEYIAITADSQTAWITLQENNAIAELDIAQGEIAAIHPLGLKSFRALGVAGQARLVSYVESTGLDVSDQDGGVRIRHWPIWGMYQPDGIATFHADGRDFLVTANEGDPRDYYEFHEVVSIGDLPQAGIKVDNANPARRLMADRQLRCLEISRYAGDVDGDGDLDRLVCPGTRSFAIWEHTDKGLNLVYDSGSDLERILAERAPDRFNSDSTPESLPDVRSPLRGPEPENVVVFDLAGRRIAAIGLERAGGAMLYDVTRPREPEFLDYLPPRAADGLVDLAPEGLLAVPANQSPTGEPLLILCNEGSGTMTAWEIQGEK